MPPPPVVVVKTVEAPKPVERLPGPPRAVEVPRPPPEPARPPEAVLAGSKVPREITAPERAARKVAGAGLDSILAGMKAKPFQLGVSVSMAIAIIPIALYLVPKFVDIFLSGLGATKEQKSWIYWGTAIILGIIGFVLIWSWLGRSRRRVGK